MNDNEQTEYLGNETWVGFVNGSIRIYTEGEDEGVTQLELDQCQKLVEFFKRVGVLTQ